MSYDWGSSIAGGVYFDPPTTKRFDQSYLSDAANIDFPTEIDFSDFSETSLLQPYVSPSVTFTPNRVRSTVQLVDVPSINIRRPSQQWPHIIPVVTEGRDLDKQPSPQRTSPRETHPDSDLPNLGENGAIRDVVSQKADPATLSSEFDTQTADTLEPPRDLANQIYCDHAECASTQPKFLRKQDWCKHMDRHTRPFKCDVLGCERYVGFTSKGDLDRHRKEVHRHNLDAATLHMCPYRGCKRNESGFPRKSNLEDHIKRIHKMTVRPSADESASNPPRTMRSISESHLPHIEHVKRRKRGLESDDEPEAAKAILNNETLEIEVKRLRKVNAEQAIQIQRLDAQVELLKGMILQTNNSEKS